MAKLTPIEQIEVRMRQIAVEIKQMDPALFYPGDMKALESYAHRYITNALTDLRSKVMHRRHGAQGLDRGPDRLGQRAKASGRNEGTIKLADMIPSSRKK